MKERVFEEVLDSAKEDLERLIDDGFDEIAAKVEEIKNRVEDFLEEKLRCAVEEEGLDKDELHDALFDTLGEILNNPCFNTRELDLAQTLKYDLDF